MSTFRTGRKEQKISRTDFTLTTRSSQNSFAADNIECLLIVVMEMIGVCRFLRRYLINTDQGVLGASKGHKLTAKIFVALVFVYIVFRYVVD